MNYGKNTLHILRGGGAGFLSGSWVVFPKDDEEREQEEHNFLVHKRDIETK